MDAAERREILNRYRDHSRRFEAAAARRSSTRRGAVIPFTPPASREVGQEPTAREIEVLQLVSDGLVNREIGQAVMDAHRTPDGRTATPTIAILGDDWHLLAAWTERPTSVQAWFLEKQKTTMQKPLHDELLAWYEKDAGQTTVREIADLLER